MDEVTKLHFVHETWISEHPEDMDYLSTLNIVCDVIEAKSCDPKYNRVKNLSNAYDKAIAYSGDITLEYICELNGLVLDQKSTLRSINVKPRGYFHEYMNFNLIKDELLKLISYINTNREHITYLYQKFLYIHPFSNGNGRTAKLLLCSLYHPFSLYLNRDRKLYLNIISRCHLTNDQTELEVYITACKKQFNSIVKYSLDMLNTDKE